MQAVITADIVNSTKLKPKDFKGLVNDIENMFEAPNRVEFYRGDSFQALIAEGADAYRLMLLARLKAITYSAKERTDIRMGISLGTVNTETGHLGSNVEEIFILFFVLGWSSLSFSQIMESLFIISGFAVQPSISL